MPIDIYTRDETAQKYQDDVMDVSDNLSFLIIQIENILFTNKKEVLGQMDFGANLEEKLFSINANEADIKSEIVMQIANYCPLAIVYPIQVNVMFFDGTNRDICVVDIIIDGTQAITLLL